MFRGKLSPSLRIADWVLVRTCHEQSPAALSVGTWGSSLRVLAGRAVVEGLRRYGRFVLLLSAIGTCASLIGAASAEAPPKPPEGSTPVPSSRVSGSVTTSTPSPAEGQSTQSASAGGSDLLSGLVGAVVGALIGALASLAAVAAAERAARKREAEREVRQKAALRVLLRTEMDQNLVLLEDDRSTVAVRQDHKEGSSTERYSKGYVFGYTPSPPWNTTAWEHAVSSLGGALSDVELRRVQKFYANLHTLSAQRAMIASLALHGKLSGTATDYKEKVANGIVSLTDSMLSEGNPLSTVVQGDAQGSSRP